MSLAVWQATIVDEDGEPVPAATVRVLDAETGSVVVIKPNRDGTGSKTNPFNADGDGFARFYVAAGRYDVEITAGGDTRAFADMVLLADLPTDGVSAAVDVTYDPAVSGLESENVQDALDEVVELILAIDTGGGGAGNVSPDTPAASPNAADDEFIDGSAIDTTGGRRSGATAWAWLNQGGAAAAVDAAHGNLRMTAVTGADVIRAVTQTAPAAPWRYRAKFCTLTHAADFEHGGLVVYNSSSGKAITFSYQWVSGGMVLRTVSYNTLSSANAQIGTASVTSVLGQCLPRYFEIENDGTNLIFRVSDSGYTGTFIQHSTQPLTTHIASVTDIGLYVNPGGSGTAPVMAVDWFRREA